MQPVMTLMCGFPRCGKTTWIRLYNHDAIVISLDVIRKDILGHQFHRAAEPIVMALAKTMVRILLRQGKDVIIDATNLKRGWRYDWYMVAEESAAKTRIVYLNTPDTVCWQRNKRSPKGERLPLGVFRQMVMGFDKPTHELDGYAKVVVEEYKETDECIEIDT